MRRWCAWPSPACRVLDSHSAIRSGTTAAAARPRTPPSGRSRAAPASSAATTTRRTTVRPATFTCLAPPRPPRPPGMRQLGPSACPTHACTSSIGGRCRMASGARGACSALAAATPSSRRCGGSRRATRCRGSCSRRMSTTRTRASAWPRARGTPCAAAAARPKASRTLEASCTTSSTDGRPAMARVRSMGSISQRCA